MLTLYIISQDGIEDSDRRRLLQQANISLEDAMCITNLGHLGVRLVPGDKKSQDNRGPYSYFGKKSVKSRKSNKSDAMTYELSRYVPLIKFLLEVC